MADTVQVEIKAPVATITLNKPGRWNAIDVETWEGIRDAALAVDAATEVRVAILTGAGGVLCAGLDVKAGSTLSGVYAEDRGRACGPRRKASGPDSGGDRAQP
jgi:enoyl-CoA hydratase